VVCTWSAPGTRVAATGFGDAAETVPDAINNTRQENARLRGNLGMRHLETRVRNSTSRRGKEKRRERGKSCAAPRSEHRGRVVRSPF
jgi:hypothetical protein